MDRWAGKIEAVVFDLDDTLYPEQEYVYSGFRAVSRQIVQLESGLQGQQVYEMLVAAFHQGDRSTIFNQVLEDLDQRCDEQIIAELISLYRCHRPVLSLKPKVRQMLESLGQHYKLGLLTDGRLPGQRLKVQALGIEKTFDHIVYTEDLGREHWKPSTKGFELMAQTLGCDHNTCMYIADNCSKDFLAPNKLGWLTVQVQTTNQIYRDVEIPPDGAPQYHVSDVTDIVELLG